MTKPNRPPGSSGIQTGGILVGVIAVLYLAREVLIPLAFAITLTLILSPAVAWLQKLRLGRVSSVLLVMMISIVAAGGISWVIFDQLVGVANELPSYQQNIHNKIQSIRMPTKAHWGELPRASRNSGRSFRTVRPNLPR